MRYHVSDDGMPRVCKAQSSESCRATGYDGATAPHGEFASPEEARAFAEQINGDFFEPRDDAEHFPGYFADGVGADESAIAENSDLVISEMDLAISEEEVTPEGIHYEYPDSSLRFVRGGRGGPSGYPGWKVYGKEADIRDFLSEQDLEDLPLGETGSHSRGNFLKLEAVKH